MDLEKEMSSLGKKDSSDSNLDFSLFFGGSILSTYFLYKFIEKGVEVITPYMDWHNYFNF